MNNNSATIIKIENLTKYFKSSAGVVKAVDGISCEFPRGKMIALKGASGSGKSTLLNLIGALDRPTSGTIIADGIDVSALKGGQEVDYRLHKVGFVFQAYYLIPGMSALENVMMPMELSHVNRPEQDRLARALLERVGITSEKFGRPPSRLSGGEQQRVAIARALANNPALVLADEPTGNLDSNTGKTIVDLLHGLSQDGRTVILATHDASLAGKADMVLNMKDGKIVSQTESGGEPEDLKEENATAGMSSEDLHEFNEWRRQSAEFKAWKESQTGKKMG